MTGCSPDSGEPVLTAEQKKQNLESFDYVWKTIRDKHYDPKLGGLDWQAVHDELRPKIEAAKSMAEVRGILGDLVSRLKQSHFGVFPSDVYDQLGQPGEKNKGKGFTGLQVRVVSGHALVTKIDNMSPAEKAGIKKGWEILKIGEKDITAMLPVIANTYKDSSWQSFYLSYAVQARLNGKVGECLTIGFLDGNNKTVERKITLAEPKGKQFTMGYLPPMYVWLESKTIENNIGYIGFNAFLDAPRLMPAFNEAMKSFLNSEGLIIDLRGNMGGLPLMAMGMAGWLIDEKGYRLGTMLLRDSQLNIVVRPRPETFKGPVAVLIDGLSASCAEIFAGGLKDLDRARLFGSTTAGAVLPSTIVKLPNLDGFQYAFANYESAKGDVLEGVGVKPDVEIFYTREGLLKGKDRVMEAAVQWIREAGKRREKADGN